MINRTDIDGPIEIIPTIFKDHRGTSIKPYHSESFEKLGINIIYNEDFMVTSEKGILRGLHFQNTPFQQAKIIYCANGSIYDVAVDIRKESLTYGKYVYFYLDSKKYNMAYIPVGFAHGYQVLEDNTTVIYKMSSVYSPKHEGGIRWDSLDIKWPIKDPVLSEKDKFLPGFNEFHSDF